MTNPTGTTNQTPNSNQDALYRTLYTKSIDQSGWLAVRIGSEILTVPEYVKIAGQKEKDGRYYFTILEGRYKGKTASLKMENKDKCLISTKRGNGAKLVVKTKRRERIVSKPRKNQELNQLIATLHYDGQETTITLDSDVSFLEENRMSPHYQMIQHSKPLPKGIYKIMTPTYPGNRDNTIFYVDFQPDLRYHTVWFPIEYEGNYNSSFVHVGNLSEGCVTIYQLEKWNSVYEYLISNRLDKNGKYIGTIKIE